LIRPEAADVSQPLVYVDTSEVCNGALGELKAAIRELAEFVDENEPQLISYDVYFSEDGTQMTVIHVHTGPGSLDRHLDVAAPRFERFAGLVTLRSIHIYGEPSEKAVGQLWCEQTCQTPPVGLSIVAPNGRRGIRTAPLVACFELRTARRRAACPRRRDVHDAFRRSPTGSISEGVDALCRCLEQLVREIRQGAGGRELLADDGNLRIAGRALGLTDSIELLAALVEDRLGAGSVSLFGERDLDARRQDGHRHLLPGQRSKDAARGDLSAIGDMP
jgi:hypothetical protein